MKWPLAAVLSFLAWSVFTLAAFGAPLAQEPRPVIAQPEQDSAVRGVVQLVGTAVHPQFQRYELYYAPWPAPSDQAWVFVGDAHFNQQPLGLLGTWDSRAVPDGTYALRVRVVKQDGNYNDSDPRRVLVANTRAADTPTSQPTATSAEPVVDAPEQPVATIEIIAPTVAIELPTAEQAPATPRPDETAAALTTTDPTSPAAGASDAANAFDVDGLASAARKAATYTAGAFLALGAFFAIKGALAWLWHKVRP